MSWSELGMWKRVITFPRQSLGVDDVAEVLLDCLNEKEIEEFAEELQAFHRPAVSLTEQCDNALDD